MRTAERGLKVIIADGECMLARQRRLRAENAEKLKRGERVVKTRYGVDDEICTGDHSCIRLSGCPSLTVKPNPDPLRTDPVATVIESCVGCGLCGEVAHAAVLCPSFYRADVISNPTWWDRALFRLRSPVIGWLRGASETQSSLRGEGGCGGRPGERSSLAFITALAVLRAVRTQQAAQAIRPLTILIAALGGEGGGVLTDWIVAAAASQGFPVQSTSIPGVAQRTGATTYHIELLPQRRARQPAPRPILALAPGVGDVDLVVASELMEAGRAVAGGFVTPDRTTTIASTSRSYLVVEKMAMGDGRYDQQAADRGGAEEFAKFAAARPGSDRAPERRDDQRGDARRHRRHRRAADSGRGVRGGDPRRRQGGRGQSARLPRRLRGGAGRRAAGRRAAVKRAPRGRRDHSPISKREIARHAGGRARLHDRRRAPPRRLSGRRLCAALSRSPRADPRGRREGGGRRTAARRDGAASRGAHVL